jgi:glutamate/tyrosine decarboxylase-like PLP-dependent enzyme
MQNNYPYFHPMYVGQMLKPPVAIAQIAYYLSMFVNPNNHALDGGLASSALEKEAVTEIASMFGFDNYLGHLTSGGTIANLEALWVARNIHPDKVILVSEQAHYTHTRMCSVINTPIELVGCDNQGRMDCDALEQRLAQGDVGTVIVTLGTTGFGAIDPLDKIVALKNKYDVRIHVDSAYGGYFGLSEQLSASAHAAYECIRHVDSIVVDPHKHGMQPYGCGCVIFKDQSVGRFYKHDSPYTYFSSDQMHLGEITLECSRAGATACALWATQKLYPLVKEGEFAKMLGSSLTAGQKLADWIKQHDGLELIVEPQLDIVNFVIKADTAAQSSTKAQLFFELAESDHLYLALNTLDPQFVGEVAENYWTQPNVVAVRMCLMKSEHLAWIDKILVALEKTLQAVER